jgi:hypothetical protein
MRSRIRRSEFWPDVAEQFLTRTMITRPGGPEKALPRRCRSGKQETAAVAAGRRPDTATFIPVNRSSRADALDRRTGSVR